jgi:hypothetical protein
MKHAEPVMPEPYVSCTDTSSVLSVCGSAYFRSPPFLGCRWYICVYENACAAAAKLICARANLVRK